MFPSPRLLPLLMLAAACREEGPPPTQEVPTSFIILVMDGARLEDTLGDDPSSIDGLHPSTHMPQVWENLVPQGLRSTDAWTLTGTHTTMAHASMVVGQDVREANYPVMSPTLLYRPEVPTLMEELHTAQSWPAGSTFLNSNSNFLEPVTWSVWPGRGESLGAHWWLVGDAEDHSTDLQVMDEARDRLSSTPTPFAVVNLHHIDNMGHDGDEEAYPGAITAADPGIVDFWEFLQGQEQYGGKTLLFLVADHGRHVFADTEPPWREHGDDCYGCRRIPFLALGAGITEDSTVDGPILLTDFAPTAAALLGVPLPWADGLVRSDIVPVAAGAASRTGVADMAAAGGHLLHLEYLPDPAHRVRVLLDGEEVSDPDILSAAVPVMTTDGTRTWACWREIRIDPAWDYDEWTYACLQTDDGSTWDPIPGPVANAGPFGSMSLTPDGEGGVWAVYPNNPTAVISIETAADLDPITVQAAHLVGGDWVVLEDETPGSFMVSPSAVTLDNALLVAMGGSITQSTNHYRNVTVGRIVLSGEREGWGPFAQVDLPTVFPAEGGEWRMERPALRYDDGTLWLASPAITETGWPAVVAASTDNGGTWSQAGTLQTDLSAMPNLEPVWLDGQPVFAMLDTATDEAWLCRGLLDGPPSCVSAGGPRVSRLAVDGTTLHAVVDEGVGTWAVHTFEVGEL